MREKDIEDLFKEDEEKVSQHEKLDPISENKVVGNRSNYGYKGSENFEHDDTGALHNYSGMEDEIDSANSEHEDWEEGYDY